jgi:chromosome segregation ATPase
MTPTYLTYALGGAAFTLLIAAFVRAWHFDRIRAMRAREALLKTRENHDRGWHAHKDKLTWAGRVVDSINEEVSAEIDEVLLERLSDHDRKTLQGAVRAQERMTKLEGAINSVGGSIGEQDSRLSRMDSQIRFCEDKLLSWGDPLNNLITQVNNIEGSNEDARVTLATIAEMRDDIEETEREISKVLSIFNMGS